MVEKAASGAEYLRDSDCRPIDSARLLGLLFGTGSNFLCIFITHENSGYKYEAPSHIASTRTSSSTTDEVYDYRKHGWYHDVTRKKLGVNRPNVETEEWAQLIKKSKDHIGYGNGMIGY